MAPVRSVILGGGEGCSPISSLKMWLRKDIQCHTCSSSYFLLYSQKRAVRECVPGRGPGLRCQLRRGRSRGSGPGMLLLAGPAVPRPGCGGSGHWGWAAAEALWGFKLTEVLEETAGPEVPPGLAADARPCLTHSGSWHGTFTRCENKALTSCT